MSYELKISPKDRAASRLISQVRKALTLAALDAKQTSGVSQQEIADRIGVNRSVVNRSIKGSANLTLRTVAEISWALGLEVHLEIKAPKRPARTNIDVLAAASRPFQMTWMSEQPWIGGRASHSAPLRGGFTPRVLRVDAMKPVQLTVQPSVANA